MKSAEFSIRSSALKPVLKKLRILNFDSRFETWLTMHKTCHNRKGRFPSTLSLIISGPLCASVMHKNYLIFDIHVNFRTKYILAQKFSSKHQIFEIIASKRTSSVIDFFTWNLFYSCGNSWKSDHNEMLIKMLIISPYRTVVLLQNGFDSWFLFSDEYCTKDRVFIRSWLWVVNSHYSKFSPKFVWH